MLKYIQELAVNIGPRGATTRAERNTAQYLANTLEPLADEVLIQPIRSVPTSSWVFGLYYLLALGSVALLFIAPLLAAALALVVTVCYLKELHSHEVLSQILPKDRSQNVIARKEHPKKGDKLPRLILVAHYDTYRSSLLDHPNFFLGFRQALAAINLCIFGILVLSLAAALMVILGIQVPGFFPILALPFALYLLLNLALLVHREIWGEYIPGANGNASGVAVMLESFANIAKDLPPGGEVWAVATGCKEVGNAGMHRFLDEFAETIADDYIINLDSLGSGQVKYVTGEGLFGPLPSDRDLVLAAAASIRQNPNLAVTPFIHENSMSDAIPALNRGYKTMSIMAFAENEEQPNLRWVTDEIEGINPENLEVVSGLVQAMAKEIWSK